MRDTRAVNHCDLVSAHDVAMTLANNDVFFPGVTKRLLKVFDAQHVAAPGSPTSDFDDNRAMFERFNSVSATCRFFAAARRLQNTRCQPNARRNLLTAKSFCADRRFPVQAAAHFLQHHRVSVVPFLRLLMVLISMSAMWVSLR